MKAKIVYLALALALVLSALAAAIVPASPALAQAPAAPTLVSPLHFPVEGTSVMFDWDPVADPPSPVDYYWLCVNDVDWPWTGVREFTGSVGLDTQKQVTGLANDGRTYYWWVWAHNAEGYCSWSAVQANHGSFVNGPIVKPVHNINSGEYFDTIQAAIDDPDTLAGHTIEVASGTYNEDITIPGGKTDLELRAASGASPTIKGVQELDWPNHAPAISILASGVKIHGFTIESPDYSRTTGNPHSSGIAIGAADVEIYDNTFVSTDDGTGNSPGWCTSIETYGAWAGDVSGLNIHDNTFTSDTGTDKGSEGIYINYNGDNPDPTGTVTISNNTFGGQIARAITTERSKTTITGNTISSSYAPGPAFNLALRGIEVWSPAANLNPNQDTVSIAANTVSGFWQGIKLGGTDNNLTNVSVTSNTVQTNDTGIRVYSSADGVVVNCNSITGNTLGVSNTDSGNTLDATLNWWGAADGPGPVGTGSGDNVSADVVYDPYLTAAPGVGAPAAPSLVSPVSITMAGTSVLFEWDPVCGANYYWLCVNDVDDPWTGTREFTGNVGLVTQYTVTGLPDDGTTFYWWVWAHNASGYCSWADVQANHRSFVNGAAAPPPPNNIASSTMEFEGTLAAPGSGVYTGTIAMIAGSYYAPGGDGEAIWDQGGFDVYAKEGGTAYVEGMTPDNWIIGSDHDAYSESGPWGTWYDPDCADYFQFSLELTADHWYLRYTATGEAPMSGVMTWNGDGTGYACETDPGTVRDVHGGVNTDATEYGAGSAQEWGWHCGWGQERIPLQLPGFDVVVTPGTPDQVTLTPAAAPYVGAPPAPTLVSPGNGATEAGTSVTFEWDPVCGADYYWLCVNDVDDPWTGTREFTGSVGLVTSYEVTGLPDDGTTFYWWVWAHNPAGYCSWADVQTNHRTFTTVP